MAAPDWRCSSTPTPPTSSGRSARCEPPTSGSCSPSTASWSRPAPPPITQNRLRQAGIVTHTEGATGFFRDSGRSAPYNLFDNLDELAGKPGKQWKTPENPYLDFGDSDDFTGAIPVKSVEASFSGGHSTNWQYGGKGWARTDGFAGGDDFTADNLLLLRVKVGDAGYRDPAGNPVPETFFFGKGQGVLIHGDQGLQVKWNKKGRDGAVSLTTKDGQEVTVPRGHTWIELVPTGTGSVNLGK